MQQLGSFMKQLQAKNDDLEKRLAASEEKARISQIVCDHEERGDLLFHHDRYQMAQLFESLILPHITNRATRVYYEILDWGTAKPKELARPFSLLVKLPKSGKDKVFHRRMRGGFRDSSPATIGWRHYVLQP